MLALGPRSRAALSAIAFAACAGAFAATPPAARSSIEARPTAPAPSTRPEPPVVAIAPHRDPFAVDASTARAARAPSMSAALAALPPIPATLGVLPPNAGASGMVVPFAARATVTAIVTGPHPFALVDEGGSTRIVGTGERIGAETVAAIGIDGVSLANGTTLRVAPAVSSADRPSGAR